MEPNRVYKESRTWVESFGHPSFRFSLGELRQLVNDATALPDDSIVMAYDSGSNLKTCTGLRIEKREPLCD